MVEKRGNQRSAAALNGIKKQARKAVGSRKSGDDPFWVRDDGALCWGNECVVINPDKNGNIAVEINKNRGCDVKKFADAIASTVANGGETIFRIRDD